MFGDLLQRLAQQNSAANAPSGMPAVGSPGGLTGMLQGYQGGIPVTNTPGMGFRQPDYMSLLGMTGNQPSTQMPMTPPPATQPGAGTQPLSPGGLVSNPAQLVRAGLLRNMNTAPGLRGLADQSLANLNGYPANFGVSQGRDGQYYMPEWAYRDYMQMVNSGG